VNTLGIHLQLGPLGDPITPHRWRLPSDGTAFWRVDLRAPAPHDLMEVLLVSSEDLRVRVIYYEAVVLEEATGLGMSHRSLSRLLGDPKEITILRCITERQAWVTVVCSADQMRELLANGVAKDPDGMIITKKLFPLAWAGWEDNPSTLLTETDRLSKLSHKVPERGGLATR